MWPFSRNKAESRATTIENPGVPISAANILALLGWDTSGVNVTEDSALGVPAMWAGVNFISSTLAALPLNLFERDGDDRERSDDALQSVLHDAPNEEWTSYGWRKYSECRTLLHGRSYTFIQRDIARWPIALWPLDPLKTTPKKIATDAGPRTTYEYRQGDRTLVYASADVIDIPFMMGSDQVSHVRPTQRLKSALGLAIAMQEYAERYFANGGVPPLALEGPLNSPSAIQRASADLTKAVQQAAADGRMVLPMPAGHQLKPLGYDPEKGQMTEARLFQLQEIARVLGLPPVFLQDLSKGTFSNTEQQDLHVVKHTMTQWLRCWEQEMNLKLFPTPKLRAKYFVEFNIDGLLRGDFKTRMEGHAQAIQNGISTPNEVRRKENAPPQDGGDRLFMQQQMTPIDRLGDEQQ